MRELAAALAVVGTFEVGMIARDSAAAQVDEEVFVEPPQVRQVAVSIHNPVGHIQATGTGLGIVLGKGTGTSMCSDRTHLVCVLRLGIASEPAHIVDGTAASEGLLWRREGNSDESEYSETSRLLRSEKSRNAIRARRRQPCRALYKLKHSWQICCKAERLSLNFIWIKPHPSPSL